MGKKTITVKSSKLHIGLLRRIFFVVTALILVVTQLCACTKNYQKRTDLDTSSDITLTIVGSAKDFKAIETAATDFNALYPNCTVVYEYVQDYKKNLVTRFDTSPESVDLFVTDNIQSDSSFQPYALELLSHADRLDLSQTYQGLTYNFKYLGSDTDQLYAVPFGAEIRGMFVNVTLLNSLGVAIPTNRTEFLEACKTISEKGYIPLNGNPGNFAQQLLFPEIANIVANTDKTSAEYTTLTNCESISAELFRDPLQFLYGLVENDYYDYKTVETEYDCFTNADNDTYVSSFPDIKDESAGDTGKFAFMAAPMSLLSQLDKAKSDYHSTIEYKFILSPVSDEGGFAYLSPTRGIAINKNSANTDWALEFMNFIFNAENNKKYTKEHNVIPNTEDAVQYMSKEFSVPETQIATTEDIAFNYGFYSVIYGTLVDISKANNPKYMKENENGEKTLYDFEHFMDELKQEFDSVRNGEE